MTRQLTVIVTSAKLVAMPSLAVNRNTYVPATENEAVVFRAVASPKVTVPGPLNMLQAVVTVCGGRSESLAVPARVAELGRVIV